MDNTVGSLTQLQRSVIIGCILGDGYVRHFPGRKDALLEVNHSIKQKDYVDWKYKILKDISRSQPKIRKGNGRRIAYRFYTKQLSEVTKLYGLFYRDGRKLVPDNVGIDIIALSVWYMDDGSRCSDGNFYLNTQQFSLEDQEKLRRLLSKSFGLETTLNKDKKYWRIRFRKHSIPKLVSLIDSYVIPSMKYKLGYSPVETVRLNIERVESFGSANTSTLDIISR